MLLIIVGESDIVKIVEGDIMTKDSLLEFLREPTLDTLDQSLEAKGIQEKIYDPSDFSKKSANTFRKV